jgi:hypothetical protein
MPEEPKTVRGVLDAGMKLCGRFAGSVPMPVCSILNSSRPKKLAGEDALDQVARRFKCGMCGRKGVKLIPTPRTMTSFEKMGLGRR